MCCACIHEYCVKYEKFKKEQRLSDEGQALQCALLKNADSFQLCRFGEFMRGSMAGCFKFGELIFQLRMLFSLIDQAARPMMHATVCPSRPTFRIACQPLVFFVDRERVEQLALQPDDRSFPCFESALIPFGRTIAAIG